jgi:UDP-glucose 4-epimerase
VEIAGRGRVELIAWPEARKKIDIGDVYSSHARISAVLGWQPTTPLNAGLTQMIDYYTRYFDKYVTP